MPTMTTRSLALVPVPTLHLAFNLGNLRWDLAFTTPAGEPPRRRVWPARDLATLEREIARAKEHFHLPPNALFVACYEAGRDGFWLHRALTARGISNTIIDSASIEVNRRRRRDKSDRLTTPRDLSTQLPALRRWDGTPLPPRLLERLQRDGERLTLTLQQARTLVAERRTLLATSDDPAVHQVRQLLALRGIGEVSDWLYTLEFFAWRAFRNRRQVGALAGLTNTRQLSGRLTRDLGISKAGNVHVRSLAIELAWSWLRHQPESALSHWYRDRFAAGGSRLRRIGIVALARKLLIALWRYLETGLVPSGARLKLAMMT